MKHKTKVPDIESMDLHNLKRTPLVDVELVSVKDGYFVTNIIWKAHHVDANSVISACINIFNTFIDRAPEEKQIEIEAYLMNSLIKGMKDRFEHTRTIKVKA